jgi:Domain of unknown function (DUF4291)
VDDVRSGWAEKDSNQNRILAIEMTFEGFEELLMESILTSYDKSLGEEQAWREKLNNSNVRIQWDPDHDFKEEKLKRRAVQIGIKNHALQKFNNEFIKSIQDIAGLDSGYNVEDFRKLVKTIYKNIVRDFKTQKFDLVLLKTLPNKQAELF